MRLLTNVILAATLSWPAAAAAQTIDPTPDTTPSVPAGTPAPPPPATQGAAPAPAPAPAAEGGESDYSNIHLDAYLDAEYGEPQDMPGTAPRSGLVPPVHVVQSGDTLWDISGVYFGSPWEWPRVWSYNPNITNPHWIFPGDQVRLREEGERVAAAEELEAAAPEAGAAPLVVKSTPKRRFSLRRIAFVDVDDLASAATVDGSPSDKMLLAEGDEVYLAYKDGSELEPGKRYAIYREKQKVEHPETGDVVGAYVEVVGELEVRAVPEGKRARANVTDSVRAVERGMYVAPIDKEFVAIEPKQSAGKEATGTIVAQLEADELIGARQAVIIDLGAADGIERGHRFYVVRRGDAYSPVMGPGKNVGQDDDRYPARAIGEIVVVDVGEGTSLGLVTLSLHEFGVGDRVILR